MGVTKGPQVLDLSFLGKPEPQGSVSAFPIFKSRKGPKHKWVPMRREDGSIMVNITSDNPALKAWREGIALLVRGELSGKGVRVQPGDEPSPFPVERAGFIVELDAFIYRAQSDWGTGKNAHLLKDHADAAPLKTPDVDKLLRSTLDALTDVIWKDDAQVVKAIAEKHFAVPDDAGDGERAEIRVWVAREQVAADLPLEERHRTRVPAVEQEEDPAQVTLV
jgi:hypothetical protein